MKTISFTDPHRQRHFDFFRQMDQPHFNICANVDLTRFLPWLKAEQLPFTPMIVYLLAHTANGIPEFRQRIRGEAVVEHEWVHPSFSVATEKSKVFSFCEVNYQPGCADFIRRAQERMEQMRTHPSFDNEPGRDDYLFLSPFPWVSFTGFTHAMHYSPADSVPRLTWGKYFEEQGRMRLPLSVQAHHALVDGRHTGHFFQQFQHFLDHPGNLE